VHSRCLTAIFQIKLGNWTLLLKTDTLTQGSYWTPDPKPPSEFIDMRSRKSMGGGDAGGEGAGRGSRGLVRKSYTYGQRPESQHIQKSAEHLLFESLRHKPESSHSSQHTPRSFDSQSKLINASTEKAKGPQLSASPLPYFAKNAEHLLFESLKHSPEVS
jgi:hypothetical protein